MTAAKNGPYSNGPLSLDDLFVAEVTSSTPLASTQTDGVLPERLEITSPTDISDLPPTDGVDQEMTVPSAPDSAEDPEGIEHEEEDDDIDLGREENDPEVEDEEEDRETGAELDEDEVDGHTPFIEAEAAEEVQDTDVADPVPETFADMGLPADLLNAVTEMGFVTPTDIQREAIPVLMKGRDVVGIAQTGTGKTAAFGLPILDAVDASLGVVQALVLAPTRELALQSAEAVADMAHRSRGLEVVPVYGGSPYGPQISALRQGAQVVVGTPGRVIDLIDKGALNQKDYLRDNNNNYYFIPLYYPIYAAYENDSGTSGGLMFRRTAFELLATFGWNEGFLPYASNQLKQEAQAEQKPLSDSFIFQKIFKGQYANYADFRIKMFAQRMAKKELIKPITIVVDNQSHTISSYSELKALMTTAVNDDLEKLKAGQSGFAREKLKATILKAYNAKTDAFKTSIFND